MAEILEKVEVVTEGTKAVEEKEGLVKFAKPFSFEGKSYESVDLSGVSDLTVSDLIEAEDILTKTGKMVMVPEISFPYLMIIASKAAGQPQEFFEQLPAKEGIKVKRKVANFLNAGE